MTSVGATGTIAATTTATVVGMLVAVAALATPTTADAATIEITPADDVEAQIAALQPGDELVLGGGMYVVNERFSVSLVGTEAAPIVIRAKDGETPHIHRPNANENLVDLEVAEWVEFRGIEWSGGSAGLRMQQVANLTIADCNIHDTGDVAVRANDSGITYENLHIVGNEIHHTNNTGEGMYLGCNGDGCRLANSIIERNWVHDTNQASVDQGDGIELKEGSYGNIIRDNVIHDTNYPCILTYSAAGNGPANIIEGNVMWNCGDHGIQSAADAVIRNNIILSAGSYGISMQAHQSGAPDNLEVTHNTIVIPGPRAINVSGAIGTVLIANNAVYSMAGPAIQLGGDTTQVTVAGNVGMGGFGDGGYVDGDITADFVAANFSGAVPNDVFPTDAALMAAGDAAYGADDDFNGLTRSDPPDVGAYGFDGSGNPGWTLQAGFKGFPDDGPGDDGPGDDGPGDDGPGDDGPDDDGPGDDGPGDGTADGVDDDGPGDGPGDDNDGDGTGTGEGGLDGTGDAAMQDDDDTSGCSCRTTGRRPPLGLALLLLMVARRRQR